VRDFRKYERFEIVAGYHGFSGVIDQIDAIGFAHKRETPRGTKIAFDDLDFFVFCDELDIKRASHLKIVK